MTDIDPQSWQVAILPLPKRFSRATALGFCGGHPVGRAETPQQKSLGCWWPDGKPELMLFAGQKDLEAGRARGDVIPGQWKKRTGALGAVAWRLRAGSLVATDLHDPTWESTWATGAGRGVVVGIGSPRGKQGPSGNHVGLVWREGEPVGVITGAGEVFLVATDGTRLAGSLDGRATLWPCVDGTPIDLAPAGMPLSNVEAIDGDLQVGIAWKGMSARAALWRGTAASFSDLTPADFESGRAHDGAGGFQVGFIRVKDTTRNGAAALDNRAVLWQGAADRWTDLNALLPANHYNASVAWAIEIHGDTLRICGQASRYEVGDPGAPRESHSAPVADPVLWTARLAVGGPAAT